MSARASNKYFFYRDLPITKIAETKILRILFQEILEQKSISLRFGLRGKAPQTPGFEQELLLILAGGADPVSLPQTPPLKVVLSIRSSCQTGPSRSNAFCSSAADDPQTR